jgi:hypothetical protein
VFEERHPLPAYVRKAVWALLACRTARLGNHIQGCPEGYVERVWYNSCRHRLCPPCAWLQVERWLTLQKARLLACDHDHVIFTLPAELRGLCLTNIRVMTQLFFAIVRETLDELLGDVHDLGAQPGFIVALHTWSQTWVLHPQDIPIEKHQGVQGLPLGGGRYLARSGEVGEQPFHILCPKPVWMGLAADVMDIATDPLSIGLLGTVAVVVRAEHLAHLVHALKAGMWATFRCIVLLTFHVLWLSSAISGNQQENMSYADSHQANDPHVTMNIAISGNSVHPSGGI